MIENNSNYPYITRSVIDLFNAGLLTSVESIYVDPDFGYFVQLNYFDGSRRVTYGNDLGLNTGSAEDIAKDKGHTKKILRHHGIQCPDGEEFVLPWWNEAMSRVRASGATGADSSNIPQLAIDILHYITENHAYPVYVKPIAGSKGSAVYRVSRDSEIEEILKEYEESRVKLAVIEETIPYEDFRVVILDGQLISAYRRVPLRVIGDGASTIMQLLNGRHAEWQVSGRDTKLDKILLRVERELRTIDLNLESVPERDLEVELLPVSNLSLGGDSVDVTEVIHSRWVELACQVASVMGLRLAGVDLACEDIFSPTSEYSILEVNASPGLDHYALSGPRQEQLVQRLYTRVLNATGV